MTIFYISIFIISIIVISIIIRETMTDTCSCCGEKVRLKELDGRNWCKKCHNWENFDPIEEQDTF